MSSDVEQSLYIEGTAAKTSCMELVNNFRESYTDTCFRRTGAFYGTMPISYENWLRAVDLATGGKDVRVKAAAIKGIYSEKDKAADSSYANLCHMSAEPHPLVVTARVRDERQEDSKEIVPLVNEYRKFKTAERYARLCLSPLGKFATQHYRGVPMNGFKQHKSIVPLCLLRTTTPWSLGFQAQMRPLCPAELFQLQIKMLDKGAPDLTDADIQEVYRGPDLGDNYIIFMTNESLMSEYAAGVSTYKVVPNIEVDIPNKRIKILRPQLDGASHTLEKYFSEFVINNDLDHFQTFTLSAGIKAAGSVTILNNVDFKTNNISDVQAELWSDAKIYKTVQSKNVLLLEKPKSNSSIPVIQEGLTYYADIMSIQETLWLHIGWEYEIRVDNLKKELDELKQTVKRALLLEKVTRPGVGEIIKEFILDTRTRQGKLLAVFSKDPNNKDKRKELIPEGLEAWEVKEIYNPNGMELSGSRYSIPNIMGDRDTYKNLWQVYTERIKEIEQELANPRITYSKIREQLVKEAAHPFMQRKSQVYFVTNPIKEKEVNKNEFSRTLIPSREWNGVNVPCSIYYNDNTIYKSFGRNMNIMVSDVGGVTKNSPAYVLNCTTQDYIGVVLQGSITYMKVADMHFEPYQLTDRLVGILPYTDKSRLIVTVNYMAVSDNGVQYPIKSGYYVLPPGQIGSVNFQSNEVITGFAYMDTGKECLDFRLVNCRDSNHLIRDNGFIRVKKAGVPLEIGYHDFPVSYGIVFDIMENDVDGPVALLAPKFTDELKLVHGVDVFDNMDEDNIPMTINNMYNVIFSKNIEIYYDGMYLNNWVDTRLLAKQLLSHGKKSVFDERIWLRKRDALSKIIRKQVLTLFKEEKKCLAVISRGTQAYNDYTLMDLDDWSVIGERFGCPKAKPANEDALKLTVDYINRVFNSEINDDDTPISFMNAIRMDYSSAEEVKQHKEYQEKTSVLNEIDFSQLKKDGLDNIEKIAEEESQQEESKEETTESEVSLADILKGEN